MNFSVGNAGGVFKLVLRYVSLAFALFIMVAIFLFSCDTGEQSGEKSRDITDKVIDAVIKEPQKLSDTEYRTIENRVEKFVRKVAHFTEFMGLGLFVSLFLSSFSIKTRYIALFSLIFSALYAASDEIHQLFINGRGSSFTDVLIDTLGACVGILMTVIIMIIVSHIQKKER